MFTGVTRAESSKQFKSRAPARWSAVHVHEPQTRALSQGTAKEFQINYVERHM
jgi:hypothetical protein